MATYQQVAGCSSVLAGMYDQPFVVLDEIHHAGSERAWGEGVGKAFRYAAHRLSLSGTPFRSDTDPIPFVHYDGDEAVADYVYGYDAALRDGGVVRPVFFPAIGGHMEWSTPDGSLVSASFTDHLDRVGASQRLRTALSPQGEWLPSVLQQANDCLEQVRRNQPDAGALAIAMDVEHATAIQQILKGQGVAATVATSDDPQASDRIEAFAESKDPWIVAVRMVSEGVDIPRLRIGVYATNIVTELFFRQAVGRLVRWQPGMSRQKAYMFVPDDIRLRSLAHQIAQLRTHTLTKRVEDGEQTPVELDNSDAAGDQLSLFQAISATPDVSADPTSIFDDSHPEDLIYVDADGHGWEIELAPPPPLAGADTADAMAGGSSRTRRKRELRQANSDRVRMIAHLSGLSPEVVNSRLNSDVGISSISQAQLRELAQRLRVADRWIDTL